MIPIKTDWMLRQMNHGPTRAYADNLIELTKRFPFKNGLEVGCMWAVSTLAFLSTSDGKFTSVDKSSYTHAEEEVEANGYQDRWKFINMASKDYWSVRDTFDFIYIDGDHSYETAHLDIQKAWDHLEAGGILAVDDAAHKNNRPDSTDPYGVAIASLEHWANNPNIEAGMVGRILYFKK